jgi:hypothetical protein
MRLLVGLVLLVACGGSKATPPPPAATPPPPPPPVAVVVDAAEPAVVAVDAGAAPQVAVASDPEEGGQIASATGPAGVTGTGEGGGGRGEGLAGGGYAGIGTIGHGAGVGTGGSRYPGRDAHVPQLKLDTPKIKGALDPVIVRRFLMRNKNRLLYCYEKRLLAKPGIAGKLTATYSIGPDGTVHDAAAKGVDDEVAACVGQTLDSIEYPKPSDGAKVSVTFSATFKPE